MAETSEIPPLPNELPVVPLRGAVVMPMTVAPLGVSRPVSVEAVNKALAGDRMVLLLLQKSDSDEPGIDDDFSDRCDSPTIVGRRSTSPADCPKSLVQRATSDVMVSRARCAQSLQTARSRRVAGNFGQGSLFP